MKRHKVCRIYHNGYPVSLYNPIMNPKARKIHQHGKEESMAMKKLCILGSIAVIFIHATGFSAEARFLSTAENGFGIYTSELEETSPAVAYNFKDDVFLVVTTIDD